MDKKEAIKELDSFGKDIAAKNLTAGKLCYIYYAMPNILANNSDLEPQVFEILSRAIQSEKNNRYSVEDMYSSLIDIVDDRPAAAPLAGGVFKKALASDKNDFESLRIAQNAFSVLVQACPKLAPDMSKALIEALNKYEQKNTPKNSFEKLWRRLNDTHGRSALEQQAIKEMRGEIRRVVMEAGDLSSPLLFSKTRSSTSR